MSDTVVRIENLSKRYLLGGGVRHEGMRHLLQDRISRPFRGLGQLWGGRHGGTFSAETSRSEFWALRDVSLEIKRGEVVGIIGRNGAGKSTLLKILSRITEPTRGKLEIDGRIASLLEVGTGFHPELTGRENVFLNGAILGMKRSEIRAKFDEIVAFAEVDKFIDTPVKRYSSGMYVRLAFAVAAHLEPEILILDEVLAVGDAQFQKKCLGKMEDVAERDGRTVIFVSHNMVAVQSLCRRALLMQNGTVASDGASPSVIARFLRQGESTNGTRAWPDLATAPGNDVVRVRSVAVGADDRELEASLPLTMESGFRVVTEFHVHDARRRMHLTYHLLNDQGIVVFTTGFRSQVLERGGYRGEFRVPGNLLNSGEYSLKLLVVENGNQVTFVQDALASFTINDLNERTEGWHGREPGVVQPTLPWQIEKIAGS